MPHYRSKLTSLRTRRLAGGFSIGDLAKAANLTDRTIVNVESNGATLNNDDAEKLAQALGPVVAITSSSIANPSSILTAAHKFVTGDTVMIAGHTGSTPAIDGARVVTVVDGTHFTIPVNVTGGGTGGTARLSLVSLGQTEI
jgi:hypothetical protein